MADPRVVNLAKILVRYSVDVQEDERVGIVASMAASPLVLELQRQVLRAGGHPHTRVTIPGSDYIYFSEANDTQLKYVPQTSRLFFEEFEALIGIDSDENTKELSSIDPQRQALRAQSFAPLIERYMDRTAKGEFKWVRSVFPTAALAQGAEMSLTEFEQLVYATTFADQEDPLGAWTAVHEKQQRLVDWLKGKKQVEVTGPNVELTFSIEGRRFMNSSGTFNMPDGEIYTSPVEDSMEGWIRFSFPAITRGREVSGVELKLENGRVMDARAEKNAVFLKTMLEIDDGASVVGEFALGTNSGINRATKMTLFDEKIGGTMHVALGAGFKELGGQNESGLHWDMVCDMKAGGKIFVDDELFYDSGEFVVL